MDYAALFSENSLCSWSFSLLAATTAWPQSISMLTLLSLILYFKAEERLNLDRSSGPAPKAWKIRSLSFTNFIFFVTPLLAPSCGHKDSPAGQGLHTGLLRSGLAGQPLSPHTSPHPRFSPWRGGSGSGEERGAQRPGRGRRRGPQVNSWMCREMLGAHPRARRL